MLFHRKDSLLAKRLEEQEIYVASRDYQVVKAYREGKKVDTMYPGHTAWYKEQMEILHDLEEHLKRVNPEAWQKVLTRRNAGKPIETEE